MLGNYKISEIKGISFSSIGEYFTRKPKLIDIFDLLNIEKNKVRKSSYKLLKGSNKLIKNVTWGIRSYLQFQDILSVSLSDDKNEEIINRHYCYYESIIYLRESIISLLDRNLLASITLLRPFLELSILNLFWYLNCENKGYGKYYLWLKGNNKYKKKFDGTVNYIFKNIPSKEYIDKKKLKMIEIILKNTYKTFGRYSHSPQLEYSFTLRKGFSSKFSLEDFYYIPNILFIVLNQIVYLYVNIYPLSLFPIDGYEKWGFSGPVGLFFDDQNYKILEKFLGIKNINKLKKQLKLTEKVKGMLDWYQKLPRLSLKEIEESWKRFRKNSGYSHNIRIKEKRLALFKAYHRGIGWSLSYINKKNLNNDYYANISDEIINKIKDSVINW